LRICFNRILKRVYKQVLKKLSGKRRGILNEKFSGESAEMQSGVGGMLCLGRFFRRGNGRVPVIAALKGKNMGSDRSSNERK
jgi:hypothetical protein